MDPETMTPASQQAQPSGQPESRPTFHALDHLAVLDISGQDTLSFLQGQGTQDYLKQLPKGPLPGAFCSAKGRVVANVWNVVVNTDPPPVKLIVHRSCAEPLQRHLGKYIPFFRGSKLTDQSLQMHGLGLSGPASHDWLTGTFGEASNGVWRTPHHFAFPLPDGRAQLWLSAIADDYERIMEEVEASDVQTNGHWRELDILAHYPWVEASQSGDFLPQSIGLDHLGGISFNKGCYTGQEVISRLHYKGQSKRGLQSLSWQGDASPASNELYTDTGNAGTWVNWSVAGEPALGLAIVKQSAETQRLYLDAERQITLNLLD
jgi:folate-binding protein YgfZ